MGFKRVFDAVGEEESISKSLPMPSLKYRTTLQSWFVLPDERCHQVGTADIADLISYLAESSRGMKAKISRGNLLAMLEGDDSPEMRWFVLSEFKHYRCKLRLFSTEQDAKIAQISYTTE